MIKKLIPCSFFVSWLLGGSIEQVQHMNEIAARIHAFTEQYDPQDILIVWDIDNTLTTSSSLICSDQWFVYLLNQNARGLYVC